MGWEPVGKCVNASKKHSQTTRRLVEDSQGDKRVVTGMHEILKATMGGLEDTINVNDEALRDAMEDMSKSMENINANGKTMSGDIDEVKSRIAAMEVGLEGRMAAMENDMKEVKSNMKEMRDLLIQLVGVTRENKDEEE